MNSTKLSKLNLATYCLFYVDKMLRVRVLFLDMLFFFERQVIFDNDWENLLVVVFNCWGSSILLGKFTFPNWC